MSIKWYSESEAEVLFDATFTEWSKWTKNVALTPGTCPYCPQKSKSNSFPNNHIRMTHPGKDLL